MPGKIRGRQSTPLLLLTLALIWLGVVVVSGAVGAVSIPPGTVAGILGKRFGLPIEATWPEVYDTVIWQLRLPRVILGSLVGAALSLAGATFQGLLRNPLADPYILGVSSGASLGAVIAIALGMQVSIAGITALPLFAFLGALVATLIVFMLGMQKGHLPLATLLLAGVALSSFLSAIVSLVVLFSGQRMGPILFWLMGGLDRANWSGIMQILPYLLLGATLLIWHARNLNALAFGEDTAGHLGVNVERVKRTLFVAASLLTAGAVAVSGVIGFVGLITPHVIRLLRGPNHRGLLPLTMVLGAIFLVAADTIARTVVAPQELPVGIVTALCGAPFFLHILRRQKGIT
ncbi:MAG TPA: iron chelate uptake ABC transporter family permease subunit [Firmicutes bacterium]|jgi:iron complex transport system permease protein|nr:iron chelate uptake ABC transporter family permease subunit [Bacillota bacterium]